MDEFVKDFIEVYIDPINEQDWEEVIDGWYQKAKSIFTYHEDMFRELVDVMTAAGIDFMNETEQYRVSFIKNILHRAFEHEIAAVKHNNRDSIKKYTLFNTLATTLGLEPKELSAMMDDLASNTFDLELGLTNYYIKENS